MILLNTSIKNGDKVTTLEASSIWDSHPGFTFGDTDSTVRIEGEKHVFVRIYTKGSITIGSAGSVLLGTLKSTYRPKIKQVRAVVINTLTSGQNYSDAIVVINTDGTVYLCITGSSGKTYGNTNYTWATTTGTTF